MHADIKALRRTTEEAISAEENTLRRELHENLRALRQEVQDLREDLRRAGVLGRKDPPSSRRAADR
jgi:polyhydroxyalkanoate synthesis regulator phasin